MKGRLKICLVERFGQLRQISDELEKLTIERARLDVLVMEKERAFVSAVDVVIREAGSQADTRPMIQGLQFRLERFKELFNQGHSVSEIARIMGTCERTAERWKLRVYASKPIVPTTPAE